VKIYPEVEEWLAEEGGVTGHGRRALYAVIEAIVAHEVSGALPPRCGHICDHDSNLVCTEDRDHQGRHRVATPSGWAWWLQQERR
jgi:hypothetical protein